jgi:murein DD-endopeptidase MepM/ murein hydrolase activator NlpD
MADIRADKVGWLQHGVAALAVSALGIGVAGSVMLTGAAQPTVTSSDRAAITTSTVDRTPRTSRDTAREPLDAAKVKSLVEQRAEELSKAEEQVDKLASTKSAKAREKALEKASEATDKKATSLADDDSAAGTSTTETAPAASSGKSCMPIQGGYRVAARFGQVGSWSRYHTGFDFSDPVGTPLVAPSDGVVTNAGSGPASGWAGNYVAIKYSDGTQTLMAHMSTVSVSVGQAVKACQPVGAIGMTGRTFGPHVHFEVYPAGVTPGDVYKAVNPAAWLAAHGLRP